MELGIRSVMCFPVGIEMKKESTIHPAREIVSSANSEAMFADGFDDAIMGYDSNGIAVYNYDKCCNILMNTSDMDEGEAHEYMEFNVVGAYIGDFTPIFIHTLD